MVNLYTKKLNCDAWEVWAGAHVDVEGVDGVGHVGRGVLGWWVCAQRSSSLTAARCGSGRCGGVSIISLLTTFSNHMQTHTGWLWT